MKKFAKSIIARAVQNDFLWKCFDATINRAARIGQWARSTGGSDDLIYEAIAQCFPDGVVKHGPFQGMRYLDPRRTTAGTQPFAKLLGSYEQELHPIWERIFENDYADVINVGCAEGYYAVGCALRLPNAHVHAYDLKSSALEMCRELAELNSVTDRMTFHACCTRETLANFPFRGKTLIISDCEGYEKQLFSDDVILKLASHDVLIEAHDFVDIDISSVLCQRFSPTHTREVVESVDDIQKALTYHFPELDAFDRIQRKRLLAESRPSIMQWFFLTSMSADPIVTLQQASM